VSTVPKAVEAGLAYVTEDRKTYGLVLIDHIKHNVTLANLKACRSAASSTSGARLAVANKYRKDLAIRSSASTRPPDQPFGRQPAEGGAVEVAVLRPAGADPRRADARHRCGRQI
jgi:hypothetical protein